MKRFVLLFAIMLMLAACGSTSTETAVPVTDEPVKVATAVAENNSAAEEAAAESAAPSEEVAAIASFPATNVAEASIVRDRDWTIGADDPLVTIIEYGDFQ